MTDVLSTNIFALLDEPSAPAPAPVTEKKTPAAAKGPTPKGAAAAAKSVPGSKGAAVNKASNARQADDVETGSDERRDARKPVRGGRGGARGSFRGRGREFDRHSGATRVDSDKKEVAGTGAWGEPTANYGDAEAPALAADGSPLDPASATTPADADEEKENTKTLEEYLAEKSAGKAAASVVASRKPNEGADDSQWKDSKVFARKEEEDVFFKVSAHIFSSLMSTTLSPFSPLHNLTTSLPDQGPGPKDQTCSQDPACHRQAAH